MLTYNQRYRPRTEREYTKTDLTVYDSAGNTALNALTVYGKSEVVDGSIKSAGDSGSINVRTESKNSLNITATTQTINGVTFTVNSDNTITVNGTATATTRLDVAQYTLMGRTVRYLSGATINGSIGTARLGFGGYGFINTANTAITLSREDSDTNWTNYVFIEVAEGYTANNVLFKPMISYSNDTTYEPYIGGTMATFTTGTPLRGIPDTDVRDAMTWDGSAGTATKKCAGLNLSSLTWTVYSQSTTGTDGSKAFIHVLDKPAKSVSSGSTIFPAMSNYKLDSYFNTVSFVEAGAGSNALCQNINGTAILIRVAAINTVEDLQAYLSNNPITLIYELATPTTEQLTQTENTSIASLRTFDGTTHFTNNASTDMSVNYTIKVPTIS